MRVLPDLGDISQISSFLDFGGFLSPYIAFLTFLPISYNYKRVTKLRIDTCERTTCYSGVRLRG